MTTAKTLIENLWQEILDAEATRNNVVRLMDDNPSSEDEIWPILNRVDAEIDELRDHRNNLIKAHNLTWTHL